MPWYRNAWEKIRTRKDQKVETMGPPYSHPDSEPKEFIGGGRSFREHIISALIGTIRSISKESDREEVIEWLTRAREILASGKRNKDLAIELYRIMDGRRAALILGNSALEAVRNYKGSSLPLPVKVAIPATAVGAAFVGMHGAGVAAFGGAIGLPVVLLIFLGTAGVTSIIEAFVKDKSVRDPLTVVLLSLIAIEKTRRANKEFLNTLRAEATIPLRADLPTKDAELLENLQTMDPVLFERHVMSFFEAWGYPVGITQRSNDYGVDGYIIHPEGLIIVQCKRYSPDNPVGRPTVQQFKGVIEEQGALKGYIVTTSRFTTEATESARKTEKVVLVDMPKLLAWHSGKEVP